MSLKDKVFIEDIAQGRHGKEEVLQYLDVCPDLWDKVYTRKTSLEKELLRAQLRNGENPIIPNAESAAHLTYDDEIRRLYDALQWIDEALQQPKHAEQHEALKRGISIGAFIDLMNGEDEERQKNLKILHSLMTGKKGRKCAMIIVAAVKAGIMHKPSFEYVRDEFMDVGSKSNYYKYLNSTGGAAPFTDEELAPIIHKITSKNE